MMYCSRVDLIHAFGERELINLTVRRDDSDGDGDGDNTIDDDVLNRAILDATGEIDSYIGKRYGKTLAGKPIPPNLTRVCCDITRYRLYDDATVETVRKRYEDAIAFLRDVAAGRATLGDVATDNISTFQVLATSADRRFTQTNMSDY
jgi:phage gp36-like protein